MNKEKINKKETEEEWEEKNDRYKYLIEHRKLLEKTRIEMSNSFDKYILSFSTGSLYLSIFFTSGLDKVLTDELVLGFGWVSLLLTIVAVLLSIFFSIKAHERAISINSLKISANNEGKNENQDYQNCWNIALDFLNVFSIFTFILGILLLTRFYFINLS